MSKITRTVVAISAFFEDFDQEMEKYGLDYKKLSGSEYFTDFEVTGERTEEYLEKYLEGSGLTVEQHQENIRLWEQENNSEGNAHKRALQEIQSIMSEQEWSPDTLDAIKEVMDKSGFQIQDTNTD